VNTINIASNIQSAVNVVLDVKVALKQEPPENSEPIDNNTGEVISTNSNSNYLPY
jgi:hypothetical protein